MPGVICMAAMTRMKICTDKTWIQTTRTEHSNEINLLQQKNLAQNLIFPYNKQKNCLLHYIIKDNFVLKQITIIPQATLQHVFLVGQSFCFIPRFIEQKRGALTLLSQKQSS